MSETPQSLREAARVIIDVCRQARLTVTTAESCTGGLIAAMLTEVPGASTVLNRGFVTYSNAAKFEMLGVAPALIARHGAVSQPVAEAMADGALTRAAADLAIAVTGVAGPGGGTATKPVGLVHFGCAVRNRSTLTERRLFAGDRAAIRAAAVTCAFRLLLRGVQHLQSPNAST